MKKYTYYISVLFFSTPLVFLLSVPIVYANPCPAPQKQWTQPERWVFSQTCKGEIADFNKYQKKTLNPNISSDWNNHARLTRNLSSKFLKQLFSNPIYNDVIRFNGVRIIGALISDPLHLENIKLNHEWWLDKSRIEKEATLLFFRSTDLVSFEESVFVMPLNLAHAQIKGVLNLTQTIIQGLNLSNADLGNLLLLKGARVSDSLNMNGISVKHLQMGNLDSRTAIFNNVEMNRAKISGQLSMSGVRITGELNMNGLNATHISLSSFDGEPATFTNIDLVGANIKSNLQLTGVIVTGHLNMNSIIVGINLFIENDNNRASIFKSIDLNGANIGGHLMLDGVTITKTLHMPDMVIGQSLRIFSNTVPSVFKNIKLTGSKVNRIHISGATVTDTLSMTNLLVGNNLFIDANKENASSYNNILLTGAHINGQMAVSGTTVTGVLEMNGIEIGQSLILGNSVAITPPTKLNTVNIVGATVKHVLQLNYSSKTEPLWQNKAKLDLRHTHIGNLQASRDIKAWPSLLLLDGFTYDSLSGLLDDDSIKNQKHPPLTTKWFKKVWFDKQRHYSPQPYQQLAQILDNAGHNSEAATVRYYGAEQYRKNSSGISWLGLSLIKWTIGYGYGYRYFYSLFWVLAFSLLGAVIRMHAENRTKPSMEDITYSLDLLLPIVKLDENHYKKTHLNSWPRYYFMAHKLIGFILASFIVAGLSGITKI